MFAGKTVSEILFREGNQVLIPFAILLCCDDKFQKISIRFTW